MPGTSLGGSVSVSMWRELRGTRNSGLWRYAKRIGTRSSARLQSFVRGISVDSGPIKLGINQYALSAGASSYPAAVKMFLARSASTSSDLGTSDGVTVV